MRQNRLTIKGSGGGGSSKSKASTPRPAREAPNTLQSKNIAKLVDVVSEGPIVGLANGLQSVFLNKTPLQNPDGSFNFEGVTVEEKVGEPDQSPLSGIPFTETEVAVGVEVTKDTPVVRTVTNPNLDAIRVKIRLPRLTSTNTKTGDLNGSEVKFLIEVQEDGGSYQAVNANYAWTTFTSVTDADATGLRVTVQKMVSGVIGSNVSQEFTVEYKKTSDVSWTTLGTRTVEQVVTAPAVYSDPPQTNNSVTLSTTFELLGLVADEYEVRVTTSGASIVLREQRTQENITISGKTTSPYEESYRVNLPTEVNGAPWNIRVTRISDDPDNLNTQNQTYFSTYTEVIDQKLIYPDSAYYGVTADAELFGQELPDRAYEVKGLLIRVPSNYDPETRTYTGIWDGTFQTAYSNNPAWVFYDLLVENRYGLGDYINTSQIDKFALYDIAEYCDEMVDDGYGGEEPRFQINGVINSRAEAYDILNAIASAFRGMIYWGSGAVTVTQDAPSDPIALVTVSNVIDGEFTYSSTALKARHSAVLVSWNDPSEGYEQAIAVVQDPTLVNKYGWRQLDTAAFMCTSRGQAVRFGKWILDSERYETETITYSASFDHMSVRPGDIILVQDPAYANIEYGGRIATPGIDTIVLDRSIELSSGETYTLSVVLPDGTVEDTTVLNSPETTDTLLLDYTLSDVPAVGAQWIITSSAVEPRKFRVVSVVEKDKNIYEVTALFHDPNKYDRVENNLIVEEPNYTLFKTGELTAPTDLSVQEYKYRAGISVKSAATLSWKPSTDPRTYLYEVDYLPEGEASYITLGTVKATSIDIQDVQAASYTFRIRGVDGLGARRSSYVTLTTQLNGLLDAPENVDNFSIQVIGENAFLSWTAVTDLDLSHYEIRFSTLTSGVTWGSSNTLIKKVSRDATGVSVPLAIGTYSIKAVDTSDIYSDAAAFVQTNIAALNNLNVVETLTEDPDFNGVKDNTEVVTNSLRISGDPLNSPGIYYFANAPFDLGSVFTCRLTPTVISGGADIYDIVSSWPSIAERESWASVDPSSWEVEVQVATSNGDGIGTDEAWSDWETLLVGDYTARSFDFRVILRSNSEGITPDIEGLSVKIDMPDRVASGNDISSTASGITVTYEPAFKNVPDIAIAAQDMATGDYYVISGKSSTGFTINFYDSTDTGIDRTFDYIVKGYGYIVD